MTESDKSEAFGVDVGEARPRSFSQADMVTCEACLRTNPPTRGNCIYCGAELALTTRAQAADAPDEPAPAVEDGFYLVLSGRAARLLDDRARERLASRLHMEAADLQRAIAAGSHLPLMRLHTNQEAENVAREYRERGLETVTINGQDLKPGAGGKKIRGLEISERELTGLNLATGERMAVTWDNLILLVVGRLQMNHLEDVVRRRRGVKRPVDRRELASDESILDLYFRATGDGWRIVAEQFDFSCLGERKAITAFENFRTLISVLRERAPHLEVNESYLGVRTILANLWPLGTSTRTGGWRRSGAGKIDMATVTTTDNETQFNNYSRLLQIMRRRELELDGKT